MQTAERKTATFPVHPTRLSSAHERIAYLRKQAEKVGASIDVTLRDRDEVDEDGAMTTWTDVTVSWTPLVLAGGWTVAGVWEIGETAAASAAPGAPEGVLARTKDRALRGDCDHCGFTRQRNEVIVLTDAQEQEEIVVGTTCVKDFLGVSPAQLLRWLGWEQEFRDLSEADGSGRRERPTVSPVGFVTAALAVIRACGYVPRSKADEWNKAATADLVSMYLWGRSAGDVAFRQEVGTPTEQDHERAERIITYFADEDSVDLDNDYLFSLHLLASQPRVSVARSVGYLSSMPAAYSRAVEQRKERDVAEAIPVNGERITVVGEVVTLREQENQYGVTLKTLIKTDAGWKVWGTMPKVLRGSASIGDRIRFDAKIEPSKDDATFGFFNRPTKAAMVA